MVSFAKCGKLIYEIGKNLGCEMRKSGPGLLGIGQLPVPAAWDCGATKGIAKKNGPHRVKLALDKIG